MMNLAALLRIAKGVWREEAKGRNLSAMSSRRAGWLSLLLGAVSACGGMAERGNAGAASGGSGTESGVAGAASGGVGMVSGGVGPIFVAPEEPTSTVGLGATSEQCVWQPLDCKTELSSVGIIDGEALSLPYPSDASCGRGGVHCEDCSVTYELWAQAFSSCGGFRVQLSVCATERGDPPCLNTAASVPYYLDAAGKRWQVDSLIGQGDLAPGAAPLAAELKLTVHDERGSRTLPVQVDVCAGVSALLRVCK